jgi:1-acyl-sn-glycerol-3-phosphate acyltransferase
MFIRSIVFFLWQILVTIVVGFVGLLPSVVMPVRFLVPYVLRPWAEWQLWGMRKILGIEVEVRGLENIPEEPCIIASKHQSAWETLSMYSYVKLPVFVLKKELVMLPIVGWYIKRAKSIAIDRSAGSKAIRQLIKLSKIRLSEGRSIIIFPEGTRMLPGETGQYNPGVAAIYHKSEVDMVPVALNSGMFWGKNAFIKRRGKIIISFLEPIKAKSLRRDQVIDELQSRIESATRALEVEAAQEQHNK